jgi:hypothetical protein
MPKNLRTNCFAELLKHYVGNAFNRSVRKCIDGLRIVAEIVDLKKTSELEVPAYKFSLSCLTYFQQISRAELNFFYNRHVVVIFVGIYRKKVDNRTSGSCNVFRGPQNDLLLQPNSSLHPPPPYTHTSRWNDTFAVLRGNASGPSNELP